MLGMHACSAIKPCGLFFSAKWAMESGRKPESCFGSPAYLWRFVCAHSEPIAYKRATGIEFSVQGGTMA